MGKLPQMREDNSEILPYNFTDYYVFFGLEKISDHPNNTMYNHWHEDVEFVVVLSGHMTYVVNGQSVRLNEGDGVFVNSQQIHYGFSPDGSDCEFLFILWHPMLLCATGGVEKEFISPVLTDSALPYILLQRDSPWQERILTALYEMKEHFKTRAAPLLLQSVFFRIWFELYENAYHKESAAQPQNHQLTILRRMLSFIQDRYSEKIYLEDIAGAANVGISCCNMIFKKYVNESPIRYLLDYRLQKSCDLLIETDDSVTEVSFQVGFTNLSYFVDTFRKKMSCTPLEYRKTHSRQ